MDLVMTQSIIQAKSFEFALAIVEFYKRLQESREYVISNCQDNPKKQLLT